MTKLTTPDLSNCSTMKDKKWLKYEEMQKQIIKYMNKLKDCFYIPK